MQVWPNFKVHQFSFVRQVWPAFRDLIFAFVEQVGLRVGVRSFVQLVVSLMGNRVSLQRGCDASWILDC